MNPSCPKVFKSSGDDKDSFDPSRFKITNEVFADPLVNAIKVDEKIIYRSKSVRNYVIMPLEFAILMPPEGRVIMLLCYLNKTSKEDDVGGWFKLSSPRATKFALADKDARHRAICALEKRSVIEVRRSMGKSHYLRITPGYLESLSCAGKTIVAKRPPALDFSHAPVTDASEITKCSLNS